MVITFVISWQLYESKTAKMGNKWHSLFKSILNIFTEKLHSVLLSQNFKKGSGLGEEMGGWSQQLYLCYHKIG